MKYFDKEKWRNFVQQEFIKIDQFSNQFISVFSKTMKTAFEKYHPITSFDGNFNEFLSIYAIHLLSVIESVIEKDKTYSQYRIKVELERMNEVISTISKPTMNPKLGEEINSIVKKMATDFFPKLYEFSGDGFRLLELNLKLYARDFHLDFEFGTKKYLNARSVK